MNNQLKMFCKIIDTTKLGNFPNISITETYQTTNKIPVQIEFAHGLDAVYAYDSDPDGQPTTYYFVEAPIEYFDLINTWKKNNPDHKVQFTLQSDLKLLELFFLNN